ncbi:MAG: glycosyltransferase family 4 protein [Patescibacteria group bacterium]
MKILILNWRDINHPLSGGAEISLFEHAKYWKSKGAEVLWFTSCFKRAKLEEEIEGIKIIRRGSYYTVHIHALFYYLLKIRKNVDIIVDNFHFIPFFTPFYAPKKKIIAFINEPAKNNWFNNIYFPISLLGFLIEPLFFIFYREIQFITAASSIAKELKDYGISSNSIHIIHHGASAVRLERDIDKKQPPAIIYLSQLSQDKGIEDALNAFAIFSKYNKELRFWVVGKAKNKSYEREVKNLTHRLNIADKVKFFGFVSEDKKFQLLSKSWVLIHPSAREGWGLNVIEANSVGVPTVGYNVTGLRDSILHMKTGILTENNTPQGLAKSLGLLIEDPKLYDKLSKNALDWSENFSWNKAGEMSWKLIGDVYAKKN